MNRPPRDFKLLDFAGVYREVSQGQAHAAIFPGRSEVVVTRRVRSLVADGLLTVNRVNKTGINLLRLTTKGLDLLVESGRREADYFVPSKSVALKDRAHHMFSVDLAVMMGLFEPRPLTVLPAWQLQRRWTPSPGAIPDLLAVYEPDDVGKKLVVAVEVDLGAERLNATFLPKLRICAELLKNEWAPNDLAVIVVFTKGRRRALSLLKSASESLAVPIVVQLLPSASGRETLRLLSRSFRRYRLLVSRAIANLGITPRMPTNETHAAAPGAEFTKTPPSS